MTEETIQKLTVEMLAQMDKRGESCSVAEAREIVIALLSCIPQKPLITPMTTGVFVQTVDPNILSQNSYLGRIDRPEGGECWIELTKNESLNWPDTVRVVQQA